MRKYLAYPLSIFNFGSDIGISIITVVLLSKYLDFQLTHRWVMLSMIFSLLPDVDMFVEAPLVVFKHIKRDSIHRNYTHFPLTYLLFGIILLMMEKNVGILFIVNLTLHFIHDSLGTGFGIAWLYPFKKSHYKFFARFDGQLSKNLVQVWLPKVRERVIKAFEDTNWMQNLYVNSWKKKFITTAEGPSMAWLKEFYGKTRWFYVVEVIITIVGMIVLYKIEF